MEPTENFKRAIEAFDTYNSKDPNKEQFQGKEFPKELLYGMRMTEQLNAFAPEAPEHVQLAARCQHIGRWEIARKDYSPDRKGYLQWRNLLKQHHANIAEKILVSCEYDINTIDIVKFLLQKKKLYTNPDTQLLEDVVCLVFVKYYLEDFSTKHDDDKLIDILKKTFKKMSPRAINEAQQIVTSEKVKTLMNRAASDSTL